MTLLSLGKKRRCLAAAVLTAILVLFAGAAGRADESNWLEGNNNDYPVNTLESVRAAIEDMIDRFGDDYADGEAYLDELDALEAEPDRGADWQARFDAFRRKALLANPLLDDLKLLVVRCDHIPAPNDNFLTILKVSRQGWDNEFAVLSDLRSEKPTITPIFRPANARPICEPELHWDGKRVLFSSISEDNGNWAIFEVGLDGKNLKTLSPTDQPDVNFFDACYAPDGTIISCSNAGLQGLPCINGSDLMANIYKIDPETKKVRQLTFEQDSDWHPTPLKNGRIMYLRWEYSDIMHYYSRILFHMNPDGTNQTELYGSGSFFPTAFKHAREFPDSSRIVGIGGGHHGRGDTGRLLIIDPTVGRKYPFRYHPETKEWGPPRSQFDAHPEVLPFEETGFYAEIPRRGEHVVGNVVDLQSSGLRYNFVFPYPLGGEYVLVNCEKAENPGTYGVYLADTFSNLTLIAEIEKQGLFWPTPIKEQPTPPVIQDRRAKNTDMATMFITNVYNGEGTKGVPPGTIKKLLLFAYHFCYLDSGGHESVGVQSSWDIKQVLGTVPVDEDGSANFTVPANTSFGILPLDENGAAVQIMRSWTVGMPGEKATCNGCHESQLDITPAVLTSASRRPSSVIEEYNGPRRTMAFETELYYDVVLKYCIGCHDGSKEGRPSFADPKKAYDNIHPFVHRPGPETDMDVMPPYEYHVSTSELWKMLVEKGHYNVKLDEEAKERIASWIDLNAPWRGKWERPEQAERRLELSRLYAGVSEDYESDFDRQLEEARSKPKPEFVKPEPFVKPTDTLSAENWPFDEAKAKQLQETALAGGAARKTIELENGAAINFVRIPAGTFVMGSLDGYPDENPRCVVTIDKPFWMSETEITNEQYAAFNPDHDTRYLDEHGKDHIVPGYIANHPKQPVARVSWLEAQEFVAWLAETHNCAAALPTEAQWEWAARAGSGEKFFFGPFEADFSPYANLADSDRRFLYAQWESPATIHVRNPYPEDSVFPLRDDRFKDNWFVVDYVAQTKPNAWGLYDMIGNVSEWTRSDYAAYPYVGGDGRNDGDAAAKKTARGGSWADRPKVTGSATRYGYLPWQKVYNVGLRVILEE